MFSNLFLPSMIFLGGDQEGSGAKSYASNHIPTKIQLLSETGNAEFGMLAALEPECKMYRLAADVFNDTAMVLDCLSPAFSKPLRVLLLSFSSILRALCGVAAGSSKASLSAHFAKWGNLGELNAVSWIHEAIMWSLFSKVTSSSISGSMRIRALDYLLGHSRFLTYCTGPAMLARSLLPELESSETANIGEVF